MGQTKNASSTRLASTIRARINRYRGHAFELFIRRKLTASGFSVSRVNEADGYTHGVDLLLRGLGTAFIPIQCKRTEEWTDLFVALREVRLACPADPLCIAIHGWAPRGHRIPRITCAVSRLPCLPLTMQIMKLPDLIALLKSHLSAQNPLDSPPGAP